MQFFKLMNIILVYETRGKLDFNRLVLYALAQGITVGR